MADTQRFTKKARRDNLMVPQAIRMAENAFQKYRTRDPYEIIDARNIKIRLFDKPAGLLGFYTVLNRCQRIGLNSGASEVQQRTGAIHELGHALNDYQYACSGQRFDDYKFFSLSNAPSEANANLAGAHLFISDEYILDQIYYEQYQKMIAYINENIALYKSEGAKMAFEEEQMQNFYEDHPSIPSFDQLAAELGVIPEVVKFKFRALQYKGYDLPNIPETRADFLKNWQRTQNY